jgi:hypothetical protein
MVIVTYFDYPKFTVKIFGFRDISSSHFNEVEVEAKVEEGEKKRLRLRLSRKTPQP